MSSTVVRRDFLLCFQVYSFNLKIAYKKCLLSVYWKLSEKMLKRDDELFSLGFCINLLSNMHNNYQENVFTNVWNSFLSVTYGKKASLE